MPAATVRYGILDLITLAARLLAPVVDAVRAEFATRPMPKAEPPVQPVAVPVTVDVVPAMETVAVVTPEPTPAPAAVVIDPTPTPAKRSHRAKLAAERNERSAETLFVKIGSGPRTRYAVATPDAAGLRFTMRLVGKRKVYTAVR